MARIRKRQAVRIYSILELAVFDLRLQEEQYVFSPEINDNNRGSWRPTHHAAGTDEKIEVMAERAKMGLPLYHPEDNPDVDATHKTSHTPHTVDEMLDKYSELFGFSTIKKRDSVVGFRSEV